MTTIEELRNKEPIDLQKIVIKWQIGDKTILMTAANAIAAQINYEAQKGWHYLDRLDALVDFMHVRKAQFEGNRK